ncbi:hypothetical protein FKW77_008876 [Venturia effusa]|uniref:DUF6697 domain-containing protein n=1 Tax=Venturia effusa TaxID=50376 RepID=A0A517L1V6_9PEZI|nr:hypothetical protein FKW77_008876 [Venturia effusa]
MAGINPLAGSFVPKSAEQVTDGPPVALDKESVKMVQYVDTQIVNLRSALVDELCSLRRDVDVLNAGGWNVKMGPFERSKNLTDVEVAAIRQQIAGRLNGATTPDGSLSLDGVSDRQDSPMKTASKPMVPGGLATSLPPPKSLATSLAQPVKSLATSLVQPAKGLATSVAQPAKGLATSVAQPAKGLATSVAQPVKGLATSLATPPKAPATNLAPTQLPIRAQEPATVPVKKIELWKPSYIRSLQSVNNLKVPPPASMQTFTRDFLNITFGGLEHSPSLFYIPTLIKKPLLPERTYYLMDKSVEPYLPSAPGQHGTKLTPFFNNASPAGDEDISYKNVPLFVASSAYLGEAKSKPNEYVYFGAYSQTRWSDRLDAERLRHDVSQKVKEHWAATLADPARPKWMTEAMEKHFYPQPEYLGALPQASPREIQGEEIQKAVTEFLLETAAWKQFATAKVAGMDKEAMLQMFDKADADSPAGLRLWFEYLECTMWDEGFYNMLVKSQVLFKNGGRLN